MRYLFNKGWRFLETATGTGLNDAMKRINEFTPVQIPHDWLIYDSSDLYRSGTGWYVRDLIIGKKEGRFFLEFDAVYMDSAVFVNGKKVCEWKYGYSAFDCEITDELKEGKNIIAVSVTYQSPNSRWYSGAGIYRNVYIRNTGNTYIARDGIYVSNHNTNGKRILHIETEVLGDKSSEAEISYEVTDPEGNDVNLVKISNSDLEITSPHLWDINDTYLYTLTAKMKAGEDTDECSIRFGIRDIDFKPETGFWLNGRNIKLNGVCEHHDLGALGAAFNKSAMKRKLTILRKMGANAIRTAHNMPAPEVLDLCDEMGFLVMTESFDMWYRSKTEFDYARFFKDRHERDIESWVKQDRNHPSVIMWSIGNEIYDMHADENAPQTVEHLIETVYRYDPYKNAVCTFASNYMPWEGAQKCADVIKLAGYNYCEKEYIRHHEEHPDWIIYGSETGSLVQSRGVYKFPLSETMLTDVDEQCSALGNCNTSWGAKSIEDLLCVDRDLDFSAGQFIWTGFDYIGEPTPYHTKNSYFGLVDTAGFPKDFYYVVKSQWTDFRSDPFVHIFPYWDHNPGQMIDVRVCSNADSVELFFNRKSLGIKELNHKKGSGKRIIADYCLPYENGILEAAGYDESGNEICRERVSSFCDSAFLEIKTDKTEIGCGSEELIFAEITALDCNGEPVCNACDRVFVEVTGAGRLIGLDNGDSTDPDSYKGTSRRLFNGKLLAMIAAGNTPGEIKLKVTSAGSRVETTLLCKESLTEKVLLPFDKGVNDHLEQNISRTILLGAENEIPVRKIELSSDYTCLDRERRDVHVSAEIIPEYATDRNLFWSVVNDKGVPTNIAEVIPNGNEAVLHAKGDGNFRLRCMSKSGTDNIRVISELEFKIEGIGKAFLDPYDFIYGSSYTYSEGDIGAGNEMGIASARGEVSVVSYENIDFGTTGSDEITIPIFALDSAPYTVKLYDGMPGKDGKTIGEFVYQKPSIWNTYQEDTWKLDKVLKGIHTLSFEFDDKIHVKGFCFKKNDRSFALNAASSADEIYGDDFTVKETAVENIGNNVSITFKEMDFGDAGTAGIIIKARAKKGKDTVHIRFADESGEERRIIEIEETDLPEEKRFEFKKVTGKKDVSFIFLPGTCLDFEYFKFLV